MLTKAYACCAVVLAGICLIWPHPGVAEESPLFPAARPAPQPDNPAAQSQPPQIVPAQTGPGDNTGDKSLFVPLAPPPSYQTPSAQASQPQSPPEEADDPSLTTFQAAVECATAIMVEQHDTFTNPRDAAYKAGVCAGKVQSYMLRAEAENPSCFPKISLEEGISMFVKWADKNPAQGSSEYPAGMQKAFEDSVPCLKK